MMAVRLKPDTAYEAPRVVQVDRAGPLLADLRDGNRPACLPVLSHHTTQVPRLAQMKRGVRIIHGNKELFEKLGRNDLCPCGSGRSF